jgi:hypothetical protein
LPACIIRAVKWESAQYLVFPPYHSMTSASD